jgi:hypothetical protein
VLAHTRDLQFPRPWRHHDGHRVCTFRAHHVGNVGSRVHAHEPDYSAGPAGRWPGISPRAKIKLWVPRPTALFAEDGGFRLAATKTISEGDAASEQNVGASALARAPLPFVETAAPGCPSSAARPPSQSKTVILSGICLAQKREANEVEGPRVRPRNHEAARHSASASIPARAPLNFVGTATSAVARA